MDSPLHVLSFDVEDWFHLLENQATRTEDQWCRFEPRIHRNIDRILELLSDTRVSATFFCLGWIAKTHPDVIRKIHGAGHEIGSHSYAHEVVHAQTIEHFRQDTQRSIGILEDLIGTKVRAYRAPGFSIARSNRWAFAVLAESGIEIDSSVFVSTHAHGGFGGCVPAEPFLIEDEGIRLKELPVGPGRFAGTQIAFSGGGYFRALPYIFIKRMMVQSSYAMAYFHPRDFDPDQPVLLGLSRRRRLRSYVGLRSSFDKLEKLLGDFRFVDVETANRTIRWESMPRLRFGSDIESPTGVIPIQPDGPDVALENLVTVLSASRQATVHGVSVDSKRLQ